MKPRKTLTDAQKSLFRKARGIPALPTTRAPAPLRELSPLELLDEKLEERRLRRAWDEGHITASLNGK